MKVLVNLMRLELLNIVRGNFHWVLLITLVAIIATFHLLPGEPEASQLTAHEELSIRYLEEPSPSTLRDRLLPTMMAFEVAILGFLFIAVTMFQEKEEGAVRAFRVSPGTTFAYTFSKITVWVIISVLYGLIMTLSTVVGKVDYVQLVGLLFTSTLILTSLGLIIAVFYTGMSDWFVPGVGILVVNMLPILSVQTDNADFIWMRIIPGYYAIHSFTELFHNGRILHGYMTVFLSSLLAGVVLFALSVLVVQKKLMKEHRYRQAEGSVK